MNTYMYVCKHVCKYVRVYVGSLHMNVCTYVYLCVCTYVDILYTIIHRFTQKSIYRKQESAREDRQ